MTFPVDDSLRLATGTKNMLLNRYLANPFLNRRISYAELQSYSEDHIAKIAAANGGPHDLGAMLTDTGAAYADFFGELANVSLRNAVRKAATQEMKRRWKELVKWVVTMGEAGVIYRAGKSSAVYREFFPKGLTEYHTARVAGAQALAQRLKASATEHAALLGEDFVAAAHALVADYVSARGVQMARKGETADTRGNRDEKKAVLQRQLFKNLLLIAALEMDPARGPLYFSQHLLKNRVRGEGRETGEP